MYICYDVWFMTKLFFKNPIFMVWVAFCPHYLFFKPNMHIFYLLFMIMIHFDIMYISYNVWFMIKLFFKNPISMVWVAFYMYIFYLLFMIMIPFKTWYRVFCNTLCIHLFFTYGTFLTLSHIFIRIQVFMILIMYCFYIMSGIFILLPTFPLKHDIDFK